MKAIIIEDDLNSAKVLAHLLSKENVKGIIVMDVTQLESYIDTNPDMVFIDLEMPRMNGYEVLEELLNEPHYQSIPIIASSVHIGEINAVRDAGFHSFIGKPLAKDKFPTQLHRILAGEGVWETT